MDENTGETGDRKEPPKIKIGLGEELERQAEQEAARQADKAGTTRIDISQAEVPPATGQAAQAKRGTSRIDLGAAEPPPAKSQTMEIKLPEFGTAVPKKSTSRIDLGAAEPPPAKSQTMEIKLPEFGTAVPKKSTTRIDTSAAVPPDASVQATEKAGTTRIDLGQAVPPPPATGIVPDTSAPTGEDEKLRTMQVGPFAEKDDLTEVSTPPAAKETTQQIILDEDDAAPGGAPALKRAADLRESKKRTARIDLPESAGAGQEEFERTTALTSADVGEAPSAAVPPKTIKLQRPGTAKTKVLPRQPGPETVADSEEKKRETARLDLPPQGDTAPPSGPKTIRIKRPDGTSARKPLAIARPGGAASMEEGAPAAAVSAIGVQAAVDVGAEAGPGVVYTVLSVFALLVSLVLVYVLLGQTYAPNLPFAGRL